MAPAEEWWDGGLLWFLEIVPSGAMVCSEVPSSLPRIPSQIHNADSRGIDEGFFGLLGGKYCTEPPSCVERMGSRNRDCCFFFKRRFSRKNTSD